MINNIFGDFFSKHICNWHCWLFFIAWTWKKNEKNKNKLNCISDGGIFQSRRMNSEPCLTFNGRVICIGGQILHSVPNSSQKRKMPEVSTFRTHKRFYGIDSTCYFTKKFSQPLVYHSLKIWPSQLPNWKWHVLTSISIVAIQITCSVHASHKFEFMGNRLYYVYM